uniref:Mitogen-activated protein kinase kinase kinase n=1 Tax=Opuntia streptacantha TaxID=393608 RepID=A0A7C9A5Q9_OPUST
MPLKYLIMDVISPTFNLVWRLLSRRCRSSIELKVLPECLQINGQPCQLSFKGSPYWMAPEVIRNSNGCNLGVDIWSLGCTVIEMATARPPWSQYEGVAALFKIGNSKELPAIPRHLSDEGKDFVRQCLQRDPLKRPTAVQLLEHPFVRNAASLEKSFISSEPPAPLGNASGNVDMGHNKMSSRLESQGALKNHFKCQAVFSTLQKNEGAKKKKKGKTEREEKKKGKRQTKILVSIAMHCVYQFWECGAKRSGDHMLGMFSASTIV